MAHEDLLMVLSSPGDHSSDHGRPNTAAYISHEINHAGDAVAFLWRNSDITRCCNRHEQESDSYDLSHAQPHRKGKADKQVNLVRAIEESDGQTKPPSSDQPSRLN